MNNRSIFEIIKAGDTGALKKILPQQDLTVQNDNGDTPITYAAKILRYDCVVTIAQMRPWESQNYADGTKSSDGMKYGAALLAAARNQEVDAVGALVKARAPKWRSIDAPYKFYTAAHWAIHHNNLELLQPFLYHKMWFEKGQCSSPIEFAAKTKRWHLVKEIALNLKDDAKSSLCFGSALILAIIADPIDFSLIETLLNANASIRWAVKDKGCLDFAVEKNATDIVKLLMQRGANPFAKAIENVSTCIMPFERALKLEKFECLELMAEKVTQKDVPLLLEALLLAASRGRESTVKALGKVKSGFKEIAIDENGDRVLHKAVRSGNANLVKYLLTLNLNRFHENNDGMTAFDLAVSEGKWHIVDVFLNSDNFIKEYPGKLSRSFPSIVKANKISFISKLLELGEDINKQDSKTGLTALHLATTADITVLDYLLTSAPLQNKQGEIVRILCKIKDFNNDTAIIHAAKLHHWEHVRKLLDYFNLSILLDDRKFILQLALSDGEYTIAEKIIALNKTAVNQSDYRGNIGLYIAMESGRVDLVNLLLENGANPDEKNNLGQTSEEAAAASNWPRKMECITAILNFKKRRLSQNQQKIDLLAAEVETLFKRLNENELEPRQYVYDIRLLFQKERDFLRYTLLPDLQMRRSQIANDMQNLDKDTKSPPQLESVTADDERQYSDLITLLNTILRDISVHQILLLKPAIERIKLKEAKYLLDFIRHLSAVLHFKLRVKAIIDPVIEKLTKGNWQVACLFTDGFKPGTPTHIAEAIKCLKYFKDYENPAYDIFGLGNIITLYVEFYNLFKEAVNSSHEKRHPETAQFYKENWVKFQDVLFNANVTASYSYEIEMPPTSEQASIPAFRHPQMPTATLPRQMPEYSAASINNTDYSTLIETSSHYLHLWQTPDQPPVMQSSPIYSAPPVLPKPMLQPAQNTVFSSETPVVSQNPAALFSISSQVREGLSELSTDNAFPLTGIETAPIVASTTPSFKKQTHDYHVPADWERQLDETGKQASLEKVLFTKEKEKKKANEKISDIGLYSSPKIMKKETSCKKANDRERIACLN